MKTWLIGALAVAVFTTSLPFDAEAKRLGGSKSSGMQRNMPERTAPTAPPAKPATPAQGLQAAPTNAPAIQNPAMAATVASLEKTIINDDDGPIEVEYTFSDDEW